ncbi:MAG: hypothetical protein OK457_10455 [Thaumarchaeota archaeon]|nr:hypothetical protein [Nitrososphaerota archaeon]
MFLRVHFVRSATARVTVVAATAEELFSVSSIRKMCSTWYHGLSHVNDVMDGRKARKQDLASAAHVEEQAIADSLTKQIQWNANLG